MLTFNNYWTGLTYTFLVVFLAFILVLMFFYRYRRIVADEISEFIGSKVSLYVGVFLAAVSTAFIIQTDNFWVTLIASVFVVIAIILILTFLIRRVKTVPKGTVL